MAKKVYFESLKAWALKLGIPTGVVGTFAGLLFFFLSMSGAITITGFSGDQVCAGTINDPCYAYINLTANEDIFIYPMGYDPWGRDTPFEFSPAVKSWTLQRSWGDGWRDIPLNETCTGTWCGAPNSDGVAYSYVLRKGKDYQLRIVSYKNRQKDVIKWAVNYEDKEYLDPTWLPVDNGVKTIGQIESPERIFWEISKSGAEESLSIDYTILSPTITEFCVSFDDPAGFKDYYKSLKGKDKKDLKKVPLSLIEGTDMVIESPTINLEDLPEDKSYCFNVSYGEDKKPRKFKLGWNTINITQTTDSGHSAYTGGKKRIIYDSASGRWHVFFISSSGTIQSESSSDGTTWVTGVTSLFTGGTPDDWDCSDPVEYSGKSYIHCAYANDVQNYIRYRRYELNSTSPYIFSAGVEDNPYTSPDAADDMGSPAVTVDSDGCVLIAFGMEDDSLTTADEWQIGLLKEASSSTCGDGDFDEADLESGFPILPVQTDVAGYNLEPAVAIDTFGNKDAMVFWTDGDSTTSADSEARFFNGTSNTFSSQVTTDTDIEFSIYGNIFDAFVVEGTNYGLTFIMDDGTTGYDERRVTIPTSLGNVVTQLDVPDPAGVEYSVLTISDTTDGVVDTGDPTGPKVYVFGPDAASTTSLNYATSAYLSSYNSYTDEGTLLTLDTENIRFLDTVYNPVDCSIGITWIEGTSTKNVQFYEFQLRDCFMEIVSPTHQQVVSGGENLTVVTSSAADYCKFGDDNGNYTMTAVNSTYFYNDSFSEYVVDGVINLNVFCNETGTGTWHQSSVEISNDKETITNCRGLYTSRTYNLLNDINDCSLGMSACFSFNEDDIIVEGNNYLIDCISDEALPIGVYNRDNVTVMNLNIATAYSTLIAIEGSTNINITNVTGYEGEGTSATPFSFDSVDDSYFTNLRLTTTTNAYVYNSNNNLFYNNLFNFSKVTIEPDSCSGTVTECSELTEFCNYEYGADFEACCPDMSCTSEGTYCSGTTSLDCSEDLYCLASYGLFSECTYTFSNSNYFNTTSQVGDRVYSPGTNIGGNYYTNVSGVGISELCTDSNEDGFCDSIYDIAYHSFGSCSSNNCDYLPYSDKFSGGGMCEPTINEDWIIADDQVCDTQTPNTGTGVTIINTGGSLTLIGSTLTTSGFQINKDGDAIFIDSSSSIII